MKLLQLFCQVKLNQLISNTVWYLLISAQEHISFIDTASILNSCILVFSKCFYTGFWTFHRSNTVWKGAQIHINYISNHWIFISKVVVHSSCQYWLIGVWKDSVTLIRLHFFNKGPFFFPCWVVGLKRVLGYSDSGRCQTSTRYWRPTRVLGIYNDRRNLCFKIACGDYFKAYLTSAVITVTM